MTKFLFFSFISSLFLFSFSFKKESKSQATESNSLLWKIEGNGLKQTSYLFGTMHLIQKEYYYFPNELEKIFKKCDVLLTEINLDELDNQAEAMKLLMLPEGKITDFFSAQQKDSLFDWAKAKLMMDEPTFLTSFGKFKPFIIVQMATQLAFFGKTESYEITLKELAKKHKTELSGLESMKEQFAFFDSMTKEDQAEMVMEMIRDGDKMVQEMIDLQRVYHHQNLDSLQIMMRQDNSVVTKNEMTLLINRNKAWIPKIETQTQKKSTFIAVGAAHLIGETGVIQLLRNKGFIVTAVNI